MFLCVFVCSGVFCVPALALPQRMENYECQRMQLVIFFLFHFVKSSLLHIHERSALYTNTPGHTNSPISKDMQKGVVVYICWDQTAEQTAPGINLLAACIVSFKLWNKTPGCTVSDVCTKCEKEARMCNCECARYKGRKTQRRAEIGNDPWAHRAKQKEGRGWVSFSVDPRAENSSSTWNYYICLGFTGELEYIIMVEMLFAVRNTNIDFLTASIWSHFNEPYWISVQNTRHW